MPYRDQRHGVTDRCRKRDVAHGNWRQVLYDQQFMCFYSNDYDNHPGCLGSERLEFHEPFGEWKGRGDPRFQTRVALCVSCHQDAHLNGFSTNRGVVNHLMEDVEWEIEHEGGLEKWKMRYGIKEKEVVPAMDISIYKDEVGQELLARVGEGHVVLVSRELAVTKVGSVVRDRILVAIDRETWKKLSEQIKTT